MTRRNAAATERTIVALRRGGKLEEADAAAAALARHLAHALDVVDAELYPAQVASLARAHISALRMLRGASDSDDSAGVDELLAAIVSAPLGDASQP